MKIIFLCVIALIMTGCADHVPVSHSMEPVGFFYGVWHGMIAPIAFIFSLFNDNVVIYAAYNSGGWYDFGFLIGLGGLSGSSSRASK